MKTRFNKIVAGITVPRALWLSRKLVARPTAVAGKYVNIVVCGSVALAAGSASVIIGATTGVVVAATAVVGGGVAAGFGMVAGGAAVLRSAATDALNGYIHKEDPCPAPRTRATVAQFVPFPEGVHVATA